MSKIHAPTDHLGRPLACTLTPGNIADISLACWTPSHRLSGCWPTGPTTPDSLGNWLTAKRIQSVIPSDAIQRTPYLLDTTAYQRRNLMERMFGRLGSASKPDTTCTARNFLSAVAFVAAASFGVA